MADWLPRREQDLVDLCEKWLLSLENPNIRLTYKWDDDECAALVRKIKAFLEFRAAYRDNNSTPKRIAKDGAKKEAMAGMRSFANGSIRFNKRMNTAAKFDLGVPEKDTTPTRHTAPVEQTDTIVENTSNHYEHRVTALNHDSASATKPGDANGVCYACQVGGERPASGEAIGNTKFSRKTTMIFRHGEAANGKRAWYATCYENSRGDRGPWSTVVEVIIG